MGDPAPSTRKEIHQHWGKNTIRFLLAFLEPPPATLRIATGFFSIPGQAQLRPALDGTLTLILVGFDEDARQKIQANLIAEILAELRSWHFDRYAVVEQLADDLGTRLRLVHAKARNKDHAKVYIIGDRAAIVGSANLSLGGLKGNEEAGDANTDPEIIAYWTVEFDKRWHHPDTVDITEPLREQLLAWLSLATPWEVYLKAALLLLSAGTPVVPSEHYRTPTEYQMVVVRRALRQLSDENLRGAMIVASTGLGKTIMATHTALELVRTGLANRVLVFSPTAIKDEWRKRLSTARIHHEVHTVDHLNFATGKMAVNVDSALEDSDEQTLIIIDESHRFRNRFKGDPNSPKKKERAPFERLRATTERSQCRVLLLTATPFSTNEENINNQLRLLPHTSDHAPPFQGQEQLGFFDRYPWSIHQVEELVGLEVATVLNTPFVARHFARRDEAEHADYLDYPTGGPRYFPSIHLSRVQVPLPEERAVTDVLDQRILRHEYIHLRMYGEWRTGDNVIERLAATAWASSPPELARTLRDAAEGTHSVTFRLSSAKRKQELMPLVAKLDASSYQTDVKFQAARTLVKRALEQGDKVVLFTERLGTAAYLEQGLEDQAKGRIASVVQRTGGEWTLKGDNAIQDIIKSFAPRSNTPDGGRTPADKYDVLIATDALAEGINLQDANTLISYDLAWTADVIIQRAGRIMRLWPEPRTIHLFCFVPNAALDPPPGAASSRPKARVETLEQRLNGASKLTEIELLPRSDQTIERMGSLSRLPLMDTESLEHDIAYEPGLADTTTVLNDYAALQENRELAAAIRDDIMSARVVQNIRRPTLVTLVRMGQKVIPIKHVVGTDAANEILDDELFGYLRCLVSEPTAFARLETIERHRHHAMEAWRRSQDTPEAATTEFLATILLLPKEQPETVVRKSV